MSSPMTSEKGISFLGKEIPSTYTTTLHLMYNEAVQVKKESSVKGQRGEGGRMPCGLNLEHSTLPLIQSDFPN